MDAVLGLSWCSDVLLSERLTEPQGPPKSKGHIGLSVVEVFIIRLVNI